MQVEVIQKSKTEMEFKLTGERHTLPQLLKTELLNNSEVEFASYKLPHPLGADSMFYLKTKGKDPKKVLDEACKSIEKQLEEFRKKANALK